MNASRRLLAASVISGLCLGQALAQGAATPATTTAPATTTSAPAASTTGAPSSVSSASSKTPAIDQKRRDIILYGIDSELIDLFGNLASEKNSAYNDDTKAVFERTKNPKLLGAILELWSSLDWKGGEKDAADLVGNRDNQDARVVASALAYLGKIKSKAGLTYAKAMLDENDTTIIPSLIGMMGKVGGEPEEDILLSWLKGDTIQEAFREAAIQALGDMGAKKSVDWLSTLLKDSGAQRYERVLAATSLGKIAMPSSLDTLIKAAQGDDTLVQASAIAAIGNLDGAAADSALIEALRDSYPQSRIAACKAIAQKKLAIALPNLEYKATNDPDKGVKTEAVKSIAALGKKDGFAFLVKMMNDDSASPEMRRLAFGLLMRKDASSSMDALLARLGTEAKSADRSLYTVFVREIASAADAADAAPLAKILLGDKDYLIRLGGLQWAQGTKSPAIEAEVAALAMADPNEAVKKLAAHVLSLY
ncbi:MAG TPA: HEAT repeat domain-containing protein [Rectinemataceae bacterium]|nr:HEAT repeat domain-containing protein [Rectinemataceae bacterium]